MNAHHYYDRIVVDPDILGGKPVVKGTRIPVEIVVERLADDLDLNTLFEDYPRLTKEDVQAILHYAQAFCGNPLLYIAAKQTVDVQQKKMKTEHETADILSLAGAWGERDWDKVEQELDHIRHQSPPTPPIELDL